MLAFRIARAPHANDLSGVGARTHGGRWNEKGVAVVYASASRALATVEFLVHVDPAIHPKHLRMVTIAIPDDASSESVESSALPKQWASFPAPARLAEIGTAWAKSGRTLVLVVPSAVVPGENNLVLNPAHPEMARVAIVESIAFVFDARLVRGRAGS